MSTSLGTQNALYVEANRFMGVSYNFCAAEIAMFSPLLQFSQPCLTITTIIQLPSEVIQHVILSEHFLRFRKKGGVSCYHYVGHESF